MRTLLILLIVSIAQNSYCQEPELLDRFWSSHKLNVDGVEFFPPSEISTGLLDLTEEWFSLTHSDCDLGYTVPVSYSSGNVLDLGVGIMLDGSCLSSLDQDFVELHYEFYIELLTKIPRNPFTYTIDDIGGDILELVITNNLGDQAYYREMELSVNDISQLDFKVTPNPATDQLRIVSEYEFDSFSIYNVTGKLLSQGKADGSLINVADFPSGVYFISIESDGERTTKKFIKQ